MNKRHLKNRISGLLDKWIDDIPTFRKIDASEKLFFSKLTINRFFIYCFSLYLPRSNS